MSREAAASVIRKCVGGVQGGYLDKVGLKEVLASHEITPEDRRISSGCVQQRRKTADPDLGYYRKRILRNS